MTKPHILDLSLEDLMQLLNGCGEELNKAAVILEKDIWVCWLLEKLFSMPDAQPMAFKGGTSLSKVFGVIDRFSEDIDITLDYRDTEFSKSKSNRLSKKLRTEVLNYSYEKLVPYLNQCLSEIKLGEQCSIQVSDDGEQIKISYPSVLGVRRGDYVLDHVLLEFGGRNIIDPNEVHEVKTIVHDLCVDIVELPVQDVTVLSPQRTFWEKVTLIHVECQKGLRANAERLSRHWFDLVSLRDSFIGNTAVNNLDLMRDVVALKEVFFNSTGSNYELCLKGEITLCPNDDDYTALKNDYAKMVASGMVYNRDVGFEKIVERIQQIQDEINDLILREFDQNKILA